ncbi:hypothetical protein [Bradyrhizobium sp. LA2.1]|uniref:hypothetical protein n=1 Tax=Bradyrhizobium sp. LA2.1 TaxID=3156376 RepID=UPI003393F333
MLMASAIFVLIAVMILLTTRPAWSSEQIPCWKARAFIAYAGSSAEAEKLAEKNGYTKSQIAEVRRRCGL